MTTATARATDGLRRRALKALRDGQVSVRAVIWEDGGTRAEAVEAVVAGFTGRHTVALRRRAWVCSCKEGGQGRCGHVLAVRLVTGHAATAEDRHDAMQPPAAPVVDERWPDEPRELDCQHGMPMSWCATCSAVGAHLLGLPGWTQAVRPGRCCRCSRTYKAGTPIRMTSLGGRTSWAAPCCGARS